MEKPVYYGSWNGRIISSIVFDGARSWEDIQEITGLSPKELNKCLKSMFRNGVMQRSDKYPYMVQYDIYTKYKKYQEFLEQGEKKRYTRARVKQGSRVDLRAWIDSWLGLKNMNIAKENRHFYLQGGDLDELSKNIIVQANSEILIVNPFVSETDLAKSLIQTKEGVKVSLITRPEKRYIAFHERLKKSGVILNYNEGVHAKIIVVDRAVAFVSSMNFIPTSTAGQSWEAGMISLDEEVIDDILNSIYEILEN
jgi:phosphatidylserine/phosphatidylglycerophosphate/cardiolipin synthase-like enzyme